jgi:hypothetical protein
MDFTIEMALVDYIPVLLFTIAAFILMGDLKNKMSHLVHLIFVIGMLGIAVAGACKATWKLLVAANIANIEILNKMFMPTQSMGFLLAGLALLIMLIQKKDRREVRLNSVMGYIAIMVSGLALIDLCLSILAAKVGKKGTILFFLLSFICSMCMGYLSSQDFTEAIWNWIAEAVNTVGQGALLIGAIKLHKAGLKELKL